MAEQTATQPLNLRAKLSMVYARVDHIEKSGRNAKQNYDYVRSADVLHAIRKALIEYRVYAETNFDLLSTYDIKTNSGGNMHTATVKAFIVFHDLDSDERITGSGLGDGADGGDKGIYKAQTGAIKNALRNSFLVPDSADPEADQSVDEATQEQPRIAQTGIAGRIVDKPIVQNTMVIDVKSLSDSLVTGSGFVPTQPIIIPLVPKSSGPLPTPEQLEQYTTRLKALREKLQTEGNLKPSPGLSTPRKILNYVLKVTDASDLKQISTVQFDAFFAYAEKMDPVELVKLINQGGK